MTCSSELSAKLETELGRMNTLTKMDLAALNKLLVAAGLAPVKDEK